MIGNILKMKSSLDSKGKVSYQLPIGDELVSLNNLVGKEVSLEFTDTINCIHTGEKIKKTYGQGYSYKSFIKLPQCDICITSPEKCHYDKGTCRDPKWGEENCFIPHYVYLSVTSGVKVGITRHTQIPTRWIDQGALMAIPILKVNDRLTSGLIENELRSEYDDRTNWRKMLKGEVDLDSIDLESMREMIYDNFGDLLDDMNAEDVDDPITYLEYPILKVPEKISSLSFDKTPVVSGVLQGIKGQYLIFDHGVLNIRKHQGYEIDFNV